MKIEKYKLKNGDTRYKFQVYLGLNPMTNKYIYKKRKGFLTYAEAVKAYNELKFKNQNKPDAKRILFSTVYEEWFKQKKLSIKKATINNIHGYFKNHVLPVFGNVYIDKITSKHVQEFTNIKYQELKGYRLIVKYVSSVFKYGVYHGYIHYNPCDNITFPFNVNEKYEKNDDFYNFLNTEDLIIFLSEAKKRLSEMWYLYFYLIAFTGMRKGEALGLNWDNIITIDNKHIIQIRQTVTRAMEGQIIDYPKTKNSIRDIEITDDLYNLLMSWKKKQYETFGKLKMVFNNTKLDYITQSQPDRQLKKVYKNLTINKITIHGLRHTFASICFEAGMDIKNVQEILGHANYQITLDLYTHLTNKKQETSMKQFSNYLDNLKNKF